MKRVVFNVRVSEDTAAAIDKARGGQSRSAWVADAIDAALTGPGLMLGEEIIPARKVKAAGACPHPKARVIKNFCYACGKPAS